MLLSEPTTAIKGATVIDGIEYYFDDTTVQVMEIASNGNIDARSGAL